MNNYNGIAKIIFDGIISQGTFESEVLMKIFTVDFDVVSYDYYDESIYVELYASEQPILTKEQLTTLINCGFKKMFVSVNFKTKRYNLEALDEETKN